VSARGARASALCRERAKWRILARPEYPKTFENNEIIPRPLVVGFPPPPAKMAGGNRTKCLDEIGPMVPLKGGIAGFFWKLFEKNPSGILPLDITALAGRKRQNKLQVSRRAPYFLCRWPCRLLDIFSTVPDHRLGFVGQAESSTFFLFRCWRSHCFWPVQWSAPAIAIKAQFQRARPVPRPETATASTMKFIDVRQVPLDVHRIKCDPTARARLPRGSAA